MPGFRRGLHAGIAIAWVALGAHSLRAQAEAVVGRIQGPDSLPIANARVTVTGSTTGTRLMARSDDRGLYRVTFEAGEGDYVVTVVAVGMEQARRQIKRGTGQPAALSADFTLRRATAILDPMRTMARRPTPARSAALDLVGGDADLDLTWLSSDDMNNLAALAGLAPGSALIGAPGNISGFSLFGLDPETNRVTLNGLDLSGVTLPTGAVQATVTSGGLDPSVGGVGAVVSAVTPSGSNVLRNEMLVRGTAPAFQWADPAVRAVGARATSGIATGTIAGPLEVDRSYYTVNYEIGHRRTPSASLLAAPPDALRARGVSPDSAAQLIRAMEAVGLPPFPDPASASARRASVLSTVSREPIGTAPHMRVTLGASASHIGRAASQVAAPSATLGTRSSGVLAQAYLQRYSSASTLLSTTSIQVANSRSDQLDPEFAGPRGIVRIRSDLDGENVLATGIVGGTSSVDDGLATRSAQAKSSLAWMSMDGSHTYRVSSDITLRRTARETVPDQFGTFTFESIEAFENNQPSAFSRTLGSLGSVPVQSVVGRIAARDVWRLSPGMEVQSSIGLSLNRLSAAVSRNPAISQFTTQNDHLPTSLSIDPSVQLRVRFGRAASVQSFGGTRILPQPSVLLALGMSHGTLGDAIVRQVATNTGLPDSRRLSCVGDEAPTPEWDLYVAALSPPMTCRSGTTTFSEQTPRVTFIDDTYRSPRRLTALARVTGPVIGDRFMAGLSARYIRIDRVTATDDRNLSATPVGELPLESRPLFVPTSAIVPATGLIAPGAGRIVASLGPVTAIESNLRQSSASVTVAVVPTWYSRNVNWSASYTFQQTGRLGNAFTAGDPRQPNWSSATTPAHELRLQLRYQLFDAAVISTAIAGYSGLPFTPRVDRDINGDGRANDLPFVFDPAAASDSMVMRGMNALLSHAPRAIQGCLRRQLNRIAGVGSCRGPNTVRAPALNIQLLPAKIGLSQRVGLAFSLSNPVGALDMLVHGPSRAHGWGQFTAPEGVLLHVTGFDPAVPGFRYSVNPRFGSVASQVSQLRDPVILTAFVRLDVGPSRERQIVLRSLDKGRAVGGARVSAAAIQAMGMATVPNAAALLLDAAPALRLTGAQVDSIASVNRAFTTRLDSIWSVATTQMASMPPEYDGAVAYGLYRNARTSSYDLAIALVPRLSGFLSSAQRDALTPLLAAYLDIGILKWMRANTSSSPAAQLIR